MVHRRPQDLVAQGVGARAWILEEGERSRVRSPLHLVGEGSGLRCVGEGRGGSRRLPARRRPQPHLALAAPVAAGLMGAVARGVDGGGGLGSRGLRWAGLREDGGGGRRFGGGRGWRVAAEVVGVKGGGGGAAVPPRSRRRVVRGGRAAAWGPGRSRGGAR